MKAQMHVEGGHKSISAIIQGDIYYIPDTHPNFERVHGVIFGDEDVTEDELIDLFSLERAVSRRFESLSERVKVANGVIYFDGEPVDNALTRQVTRFLNEGVDFKPLVNFFEKVQTNPNEHSREQLYSWLDKHNFTITKSGDFIAYKGVSADRDMNVFKSISSGRAIVDGVEHTGQIPQQIGSVVEMPRSEVQFDPAVGCSTGLHAGTWSYARGFSRDAVLEVAINPRDVVSVPTDSGFQKLRVSRYRVVNATEVEREEAYTDEFDEDFDDEWGEDESWDEDYVGSDWWVVEGDFPSSASSTSWTPWWKRS